ncbi:MAG TPA: metalloregulator ArsR/SmtB family transcription factor [Actinotalea sp.]|nr:metalloregulator ArsR/SmtB family transcription factor [Actinotalea sp.]
MDDAARMARAAEVFKVLGGESRLRLLWLLSQEPHTVGSLARASGLAQPLVSQHLRVLRQSDLATASRHGKEVVYRLADTHVSHVIADALAHVDEHGPADPHHTHPTKDGTP